MTDVILSIIAGTLFVLTMFVAAILGEIKTIKRQNILLSWLNGDVERPPTE